MEKRKPERRDRTAAPRPAATPPAMRHRTATRSTRAKKMQLRRSKCTTYDDVAFNLPIVAFTLSGDRFFLIFFYTAQKPRFSRVKCVLTSADIRRHPFKSLAKPAAVCYHHDRPLALGQSVGHITKGGHCVG